MSERQCAECRFCAFGQQLGAMVLQCRLEPPKIFVVPSGPAGLNFVSIWPVVDRDQWCGGFAATAPSFDAQRLTA